MKADARAAKAVRAAEDHHRAGRLLQADAMYREALELQPRHAHALHMLGVIALQYDDPGTALPVLERAAAIEPGNAEIRANLGYALLRLGRREDAAAQLRAALALQPDHVLALNNLGNALMQLGRDEEAIACYRAAAAARPDDATSHFNLGVALRGWGQLEQAAASLEAALSLQPRFAEAHNVLGALRQETGLLGQAAASLEAALRAKPDYADAHFNLHAVRLDLDGPPAAIACLERAVRLQPGEPRYRFFLGMLLEHAGDAAAARPHLAAAAQGGADDRARVEGWDYVRSRNVPVIAGSAMRAFRIGLDAARPQGLVLEFGVRFGVSTRQIAGLAGQELHGFDSFEGLPEDWHGEAKGAYSTGGALPPVPANVRLHRGWFEDSLPDFLASHPGPVRFANIDCDLHSSTRTVLRHLGSRVVPGSVIAFDEYLGYEHWRDDEFRAFHEAVAEHGWRYEYLCCSFFTKQAVVRIL
jgi:tetratricopeptide (TPR) repeat protein